MNVTPNSCLMDEILLELDNGRQSIRKQIGAISDIIEKSNNVLLQIEGTRPLNQISKSPNTISYTYNRETFHLLTRIVASYLKIAENHDGKAMERLTIGNDTYDMENLRDFDSFLVNNKQKAECLGGAVRKLLAINDTVAQMTANLEHNPTDDDKDNLSE